MPKCYDIRKRKPKAPIALISEVYIDRTRNASYGDSGEYVPSETEPGKLYKRLQREYGRCTGRVYIDDVEAPGGARAIGWVFLKRMRYEDARDDSPKSWYLREVWVSCHTAKTETKKIPHYAEIGGRP